MGFVTGLMGPYMRLIPVLGSVAKAFSLFTAFVFVPWLAMRIKTSLATLAKAEPREHAGGDAGLGRLGDLPIQTPNGVTIPLAELGRFEVRPRTL